MIDVWWDGSSLECFSGEDDAAIERISARILAASEVVTVLEHKESSCSLCVAPVDGGAVLTFQSSDNMPPSYASGTEAPGEPIWVFVDGSASEFSTSNVVPTVATLRALRTFCNHGTPSRRDCLVRNLMVHLHCCVSHQCKLVV